MPATTDEQLVDQIAEKVAAKMQSQSTLAGATYLINGSALQLQVISAVTATLQLELQTFDADPQSQSYGEVLRFQVSVATGSTGVLQSFNFPMKEAYLLSAKLSMITSGIRNNQVYALLNYIADPNTTSTITFQTFFAGIVTNISPLFWPGTKSDPYPLHQIDNYAAIGNPAAGANFSSTMSSLFGGGSSTGFRIKAVSFTLTCSAAAANRYVVIQLKSGATLLASTGNSTAITASQVANVCASINGGSGTSTTVTMGAATFLVQMGLPDVLTFALTVNSLIANMDAGDQLSTIEVTAEIFPSL